jgi:D-glycero-alpha-D-manno-heptose-7-phosphate kinase
MILTKTPLRLSLFGGGTDLAAFYKRSPGTVFGGAINKYIYVALKPRFDGKTRACYSRTELVDNPSDLEHDIVRTTLLKAKISGIDFVSFSDVPPDGSGLGSSSALTVGLVNAISVLEGTRELYEQNELAAEACKIEIDECHKPIGKQDQYFAAMGGVREFTFESSGEVNHTVANRLNAHNLREHLLLLHTKLPRQSDSLLIEQQANTLSSDVTFRTLQAMAQMAGDAADKVRRGDLTQLGEMLDTAWKLKKTLANGISTTQIDTWYEKGKEAGAQGGKILGAGGGGFLVFFAAPNKHANIIAALPELPPISFDWDHSGTQVVYQAPSSPDAFF